MYRGCTRCGRRARRRCGSGEPTSWATRRCRWTRRCATSSRSATGRRPAGPVALLANLRTWGWLFNPISLYFCADGRRRAGSRRWLPRSRTLPGTSGALTWSGRPGRIGSPRACTCRPSCPWTSTTGCDTPRPGRALRGPIRRDARRRASVRRHAVPAPPDARPPGPRTAAVANPLLTHRVSAGIYAQAARLRLRGAPFHRHPADGRTSGAGRGARCDRRVADIRRDRPTVIDRGCAYPTAACCARRRAGWPVSGCCSCVAACRGPAGGAIEVTEAGQDRRLGAGEPVARVTVARPRDLRSPVALRLGRTRGVLRRRLVGCDDLTALVRVLFRRTRAAACPLGRARRRRAGHARPAGPVDGPGRADDRRNVAGALRPVQRVLRLMLDETMTYSCAVFEQPDCRLRDAQVAKIDRLCTKLELRPERPPGRDRLRLGRVRRPRRRALRVPGDHHHHLRGPARLRRQAGRRGRPGRPGHGARRGLARPASGASTSWSRSR